MSRPIRFLLVFVALAWAAGAAPARGSAAELTRLRALLVIDTKSTLRESVAGDRDGVRQALRQAVPAGRLTLTVLTGEQVTRQNILGYYRTLQTNPGESLLFYYSGHGANDPRKGRYFVLENARKGKAEPVFRSEIRRAMEQKGAGLVVLLSDCCSDPLRVGALRSRGLAAVHWPAVRCLFFQHRGVVDVTAAQDNTSAWGDEHGGVFTRSLLDALAPKNFAKLDGNKDRFVSWEEFFPRLRGQTEASFHAFAARARSQGKIVDQSTQRPLALALARPLTVAPGGPAGPTGAVAVCRLVNRCGKPLHYRYRLTGGEWRNGSLAETRAVQLAAAVPGSAKSARVEIEVEAGSNRLAGTLDAVVWQGGAPPAGFGKEYRVVDGMQYASQRGPDFIGVAGTE